MPRIPKFEETLYEKTEFSGKILMYSSISWNVLFPIVDIIRLLKKNTIIGHTYGKGQTIIKHYGSQYGHTIIGYDLKNKNDYLQNLRMINNIFIFTDESDVIATNLINASKKNKINVICYSNLDHIYHFYKNGSEKIIIKTPQEVIDLVYELSDFNEAKKMAELFPDFEIIEPSELLSKSTLEECMEMMKKVEIEAKNKQVVTNKIYFDPATNKLKKVDYERSQRNRNYEEESAIADKKIANNKSLIRSFFKSKV